MCLYNFPWVCRWWEDQTCSAAKSFYILLSTLKVISNEALLLLRLHCERWLQRNQLLLRSVSESPLLTPGGQFGTHRIAHTREQFERFVRRFINRNSSTDIVSLCCHEQWAHSLLLPADCGHFVHRPLRAAGSGERRLPCGILHAASISFPGAGLCQGLTNALELPRSRLATVSHRCSTLLWTKRRWWEAPDPQPVRTRTAEHSSKKTISQRPEELPVNCCWWGLCLFPASIQLCECTQEMNGFFVSGVKQQWLVHIYICMAELCFLRKK